MNLTNRSVFGKGSLLVVAAAFAASGFLFLTAHAATWNVSVGSSGACTVDDPNCATIQAAVNAATSSDVISVAAGTYTEQVVIDKDLTLTGAGVSLTTIQAPASMADDSVGQKVVLETTNSSNVTISGLTVSGPGSSGCNSINYGVFVIGSSTLNISDSTIINIQDTPFGGCQNGGGIRVGSNFLGQVGHATINNVTISDYQKGGIVVDGSGSSGTITNNTIHGVGPTSALAQNGIQVSRGASAVVANNDVSGNAFTGTHTAGIDDSGAGVLVYLTSNVQVNANNLHDNEVGVFLEHPYPGSGEVGTNQNISITANSVLANTREQIHVDGSDSILIQNNNIDAQGKGASACLPGLSTSPDTDERYFGVRVIDSVNVSLQQNQIKGVKHPAGFEGCQSGVAVFVQARSGSSTTAVVNGNTVSDYQKGGIVVDAGAGGGASVSATVTDNAVTGWGPTAFIAQNGIQVSRGATATVTNNQISGNVYTGGVGVCAGDGSSASDKAAFYASCDTSTGLLLYNHGTGVVASGNAITSSQVDIDVSGPEGATLHNNSILSSALYALHADTVAVDAINNWWGSASDPSAAVTGTVAFDPWIANIALSPATETHKAGEQTSVTATILNSTGTPVTGSGLSVRFTRGPVNEGQETLSVLSDGSVTHSFIGQTVGDTSVSAEVLFAGQSAGLPATAAVRTFTAVGGVSVGGGGGGGGAVVPPVPPAVVVTIPAIPPAVGQVLGAAAFSFTGDLAVGAQSGDVRELQSRLREDGVYDGPVTGYFGPLTQAGVKAYQKKHGVPDTGIVGPLTRAKLNSSLAAAPAAGEVLGANTSAEAEAIKAQIASLQTQLAGLLQQLVRALQAQLGQ